jgi:hypothetical protein
MALSKALMFSSSSHNLIHDPVPRPPPDQQFKGWFSLSFLEMSLAPSLICNIF